MVRKDYTEELKEDASASHIGTADVFHIYRWHGRFRKILAHSITREVVSGFGFECYSCQS